MLLPPPRSTLFPYTTLFRSKQYLRASDTLLVSDYGYGAASPEIVAALRDKSSVPRSEEHTSELQSRPHLVCRLLLEKKKLSRFHLIMAFCSSYLQLSCPYTT